MSIENDLRAVAGAWNDVAPSEIGEVRPWTHGRWVVETGRTQDSNDELGRTRTVTPSFAEYAGIKGNLESLEGFERMGDSKTAVEVAGVTPDEALSTTAVKNSTSSTMSSQSGGDSLSIQALAIGAALVIGAIAVFGGN